MKNEHGEHVYIYTLSRHLLNNNKKYETNTLHTVIDNYFKSANYSFQVFASSLSHFLALTHQSAVHADFVCTSEKSWNFVSSLLFSNSLKKSSFTFWLLLSFKFTSHSDKRSTTRRMSVPRQMLKDRTLANKDPNPEENECSCPPANRVLLACLRRIHWVQSYITCIEKMKQENCSVIIL